MKSYRFIYTGLFSILAAILLLGFTVKNNKKENIKNVSAIGDSSGVYNGGSMMGRGIMGRGMMNGRMMGGGMMYGNEGNPSKSGNSGKWTAPVKASNLTNPLKNIAEASRKGRNIFNAQCFTCHGTDGKGDGPAAVSLNPKPANLTSASVQNQSDGAIFWEITNGNSPMPSFKYALSKTQRWELVNYIRELGK